MSRYHAETYRIVLTILVFFTLWWAMWLRTWRKAKQDEIKARMVENERKH